MKVWDLRTGASPHCLAAHPGPVVGIDYDKASRILYSASGAIIRAWDLRASNIKPIKTLCSSGIALSGNASVSALQVNITYQIIFYHATKIVHKICNNLFVQ